MSLFRSDRQTARQTGQALIELLVILPVFLLLFACVLPLTAYGIFPTWLDERLALSQLTEKTELIPDILSEAHGSCRTPTYPDEETIEETSTSTPTGNISFSLPGVLPDRMIRHELSMTLTRKDLLAGSVMASWSRTSETVTRSLSLLIPDRFEEQDVSRHVKSWSLVGVLRGKDTVLKKLGINLFHLNLDAVPANDSGGKPDETK
ncbi:MAG: hypothetical protein P1S46_00680 [bacterium]|nr:hypothetical protein [bacterium]MDT8395524.1 hypothetical protein [bacterium]